MLNEQKSVAALCFFIIIDTVPAGGQVHVVVIPGGAWGPDWGQMKKFSRLANARHDPPAQIS